MEIRINYILVSFLHTCIYSGMMRLYCELEDWDAVTKKTFTIELERMGYGVAKIGSTRYYKGLRLIKE